jgi:hypothetical protein
MKGINGMVPFIPSIRVEFLKEDLAVLSAKIRGKFFDKL